MVNLKLNNMDSIIFGINGNEKLLKQFKSTYDKWAKFDNQLTFGKIKESKFSDNEIGVELQNSVRNKRVYLLSTPNDSDGVLEINLAIDACKRSGSKEIIILLTYFPYSRADKITANVREALGAKMFAEMLENRGADIVVTLDLHADQIQGFFKIPVVRLEGRHLFAPTIKQIIEKNPTDFVLVAPDAGATKRIKKYGDLLRELYDMDLPFVILDKTRPKANVVSEMVLIGDVKDKDLIIIDDLIDTAGTLTAGIDELKKQGARSVSGFITHGVLSGPAHERILTSKIDKLFISDSLPLKLKNSKIKAVTCANIFAKAVYSYENNHSFHYLTKDYTYN